MTTWTETLASVALHACLGLMIYGAATAVSNAPDKVKEKKKEIAIVLPPPTPKPEQKPPPTPKVVKKVAKKLPPPKATPVDYASETKKVTPKKEVKTEKEKLSELARFAEKEKEKLKLEEVKKPPEPDSFKAEKVTYAQFKSLGKEVVPVFTVRTTAVSILYQQLDVAVEKGQMAVCLTVYDGTKDAKGVPQGAAYILKGTHLKPEKVRPWVKRPSEEKRKQLAKSGEPIPYNDDDTYAVRGIKVTSKAAKPAIAKLRSTLFIPQEHTIVVKFALRLDIDYAIYQRQLVAINHLELKGEEAEATSGYFQFIDGQIRDYIITKITAKDGRVFQLEAPKKQGVVS